MRLKQRQPRYAAAILDLGLDRDTEVRTLRAFSKLLWPQNDLINRHYAAAAMEAELAAAV